MTYRTLTTAIAAHLPKAEATDRLAAVWSRMLGGARSGDQAMRRCSRRICLHALGLTRAANVDVSDGTHVIGPPESFRPAACARPGRVCHGLETIPSGQLPQSGQVISQSPK